MKFSKINIVRQIKHRITQKKSVVIITIVFLFVIKLFFDSNLSPDLYFISFEAIDNISCYNSKFGDVLKSADDLIYSEQSIFFVETSCRGDLTVRQLCSVEAAARHNPEWQVHVLFTSPINETIYRTGVLSALTNITNVIYSRVHLPEFANGTPLESMISGGALNRTRWKFSHTSDALRYLVTYKYAGLYLDLDAIVAKSLFSLGKNWASAEDGTFVSSAMLSFGRDKLGRALTHSAIRYFETNFRGDDWGQNGPVVITNVLRKLCGVYYTHQMTPDRCQGFKVLPRRKCFPIKKINSKLYYKKRENVTDYDAYIYHIYNTFTTNFMIEKGSLYEYIAKKHCPITYSTFNFVLSKDNMPDGKKGFPRKYAQLGCKNIYFFISENECKNKTSIMNELEKLPIVYSKELSPDLYFINNEHSDNTSCYNTKFGDVLKSADDLIYSEQSIFFVETSCRGDLTVRQLCSVEAAAKHHPDWQVHVVFTAPINETIYRTGVLSALNNVTNVIYSRVHLPEFAKGTPLESMIFGGALNRSRWKYVHTADVLRCLLIYKYGGLYLDLDAIAAKPLTSLGKNWAAVECETYVSNAIFAFGRDKLGRSLIHSTIRDLKENYRGDVWGQNGPILITRVLRKLCGVSYTHQMTPEKCQGFRLLKRRMCFPIPTKKSELYFKKSENVTDLDVYIYHFYNNFSKKFKVENGSLFEYLAKKHCPITYNSLNIYAASQLGQRRS